MISETCYDVKITLHSIKNCPISDLHSLSSDPYLRFTLNSHNLMDDDYAITYRTPTHHKNLNPVFASTTFWRVNNIPASGFHLRVDAYDEDPINKDDGIGHKKLDFSNLDSHWRQDHMQFSLKRRGGGSWRAYACAPVINMVAKRENHEVPGHRPVVEMSFEVIGVTENKNSWQNMPYTAGPAYFSKHFSRLAGRLAGIKEKAHLGDSDSDAEPEGNVDEQNEKRRKEKKEGKDGKSKPPKYRFQANELQLPGPVPPELRHKFVPSKLFIKKLFTGFLLPHFLHNHHRRIFSRDTTTVYGVVPDISEYEKDTPHEHPPPSSHSKHSHSNSKNSADPSDDTIHADSDKHSHHSGNNNKLQLADRFLEMCGELTNDGTLTKQIDPEHQDDEVNTGGYLFTYVLLEDALFRWAEVGFGWAKEVGSKHVVLANGAKYVAFAGEFIVRRKPQHHAHENGPQPKFELLIDNSSGTYRPPTNHCKIFQEYLRGVFGDEMEVRVMSNEGEEGEKMKKMKEEHLKRGRERGEVQGEPGSGIEGGDMVTDSSSSSDEEDNNVGHRVRPPQEQQQH